VGFLQRDEPRPARLVLVALDQSLHAQHGRNGEPTDVGVEHADRQPPLRQQDSQVGGDRRLADPALARSDGHDADGGRDVGVRCVLPRLGHVGRGQGDGHVHLAALAVDVDAVDYAQVDHVVAQLGIDHPPQRAADGLIGHRGDGHHVLLIYFFAVS
jgi:hypothetical protein